MADFGMEGSTYGGYGSRDYTKAVLQYAGRDYTKGKELSQLSGKGAGAADQQGRMAWDGRPYDLVDWEAEERRGCCARTWRAKWNLKPRGPRWLPEIIRMTWYLQIINLVFSIQGGVDGDLGGPFFYSRTSCCGHSGTPKELPAEFDVHYPDTMKKYHLNVSTIKACDLPILKRHDPNWSHSVHCPNWKYVKKFTQSLQADRSVYINAVSLIALPMGAGIGDSIGRKPVLIFSSIMGIKSHIFNLLSSLPWFITHDPNAMLLYASSVLSGLTSGSGPVSMGMMVDLIPGDMREQGFPVMALFGAVGPIVVFAIGFYLLGLYLTSYTSFWIITTGTFVMCFLFQYFLLPESMPDELKRPFDLSNLLPTTYYWRSIKMIGKQGLLIGVCICYFITAFTQGGIGSIQTNQLLFGPLEYTQQYVLIPGIIQLGMGIIGNSMAAVYLPKLGVWFCFFAGSTMQLLALLGYTIWPIWWMNYYDCWGANGCPEHLWVAKLGPVIWGSLIQQFFSCFANPAAAVILSKAVGQEEQASAQAAYQLVQKLSGMWSNKAYTSWFFNTNAKSWAVVYYGFFSFGVNCVAFAIAIFTYWLCVYRPEMAAKDTDFLLKRQAAAQIESTANPRRRVGLVGSISESVNYRQWTSDDYRRANPDPNDVYIKGHGMSAARQAQNDARLRRELESLSTM